MVSLLHNVCLIRETLTGAKVQLTLGINYSIKKKFLEKPKTCKKSLLHSVECHIKTALVIRSFENFRPFFALLAKNILKLYLRVNVRFFQTMFSLNCLVYCTVFTPFFYWLVFYVTPFKWQKFLI